MNGLRRSLIADLRMLAPSHVIVETNTSCYSDEYLAQRIGLIPFEQHRREETGVVAQLSVEDRDAWTSDIVSDVIPTSPSILIAHLQRGQEISLTIHFTTDTAHRHARFQRTAAVGMRPTHGGYSISFDSILGASDGKLCLEEAVESLRTRLQTARAAVLAHGTP